MNIKKRLNQLFKLNCYKNEHIKQAPFVVLKNIFNPAVLVEVAFISNEDIEHNIIHSNLTKQFANSIYLGIRDYLEVDKKGEMQ